jgi:hypothetical protein
MVTLRVMSRPGRITQPGHVMTIVRNVIGEEAVSHIGRVRLVSDPREGKEVRPHIPPHAQAGISPLPPLALTLRMLVSGSGSAWV